MQGVKAGLVLKGRAGDVIQGLVMEAEPGM